MDRIANLLFHSSSVEKLEREHATRWQITTGFNQVRVEEDIFHLEFFPHCHIIDLNKVKVILDATVFSKGTRPRYVDDENILFFANEAHRVEFLTSMGFEEEWIKNNLLPQEAEIIPFPLPRVARIARKIARKQRTLPRIQIAERAQKYYEVATKSNLGIQYPGGQQTRKPSAGVFFFIFSLYLLIAALIS